MRSVERLTLERADAPASAIMVALLGCSAAIAALAALAGAWHLVLVGAAIGGSALVLLTAADWIDTLLVMPVVLPLPALAGTGSLRLTLALVFTGVVLAGWLLRRAARSRDGHRALLPRRSIAAFFIAVVVSAVFAQYPAAAARELVNIGLMLGLFIVAAAQLGDQPKQIGSLALIVAMVVGISGIAALLEMVGLLPARFPLSGTGLNRATLGFGWPNELGMFFAVAIPLCVHAVGAARGTMLRTIATALLFFSLAGLMATFSRGAWLSVIAASAVLLLAREYRFTIRIWTVAIIVVVVADVVSGGTITGRLVNTVYDPLVGQRFALMVAALLVFREYPIIGIGPGGFAESLEGYGPQVDWLWNYVGTAHNAYLDVAAEMGIIGLVTFLCFMGTVFWILLRGARRFCESTGMNDDERSLRRALLWSFATVCVISFTVWPFAHGVGQLVMLIAAMGFALERQPQ